MHSLDFISKSPHLFIFQKSSNKTNLGGVLFFIYVVACLTIFLYFLLDYTKNNKYNILYTYIYNDTLVKDNEDMLKNDTLNPEINGYFFLYNNTKTKEYLNKNFMLVNHREKKASHEILHFKEKVSEIDIGVYYRCDNENCSLRKEDKLPFYIFQFSYIPYLFSHQNKSSPIYQDPSLFFSLRFEFSFNIKIKQNLEWQIIKYIDKGGLFSEGKEYIGGSIKFGNTFIYDEPLYKYIEINIQKPEKYVQIYQIKINNGFDYYDEYIRTEVSWLTIISNSLSLWLSLYNGFSFAFSFLYADNFNNYKIIQNILSKRNKVEIKKNDIKLGNNIDKDEKLINSHNIEKDLVINDDFDEEDNINSNTNDFQNKTKEEDSLELPKLHLFDYILNNIYCSRKCCCNYKKQILISTSNYLLSKYFSTENILYNQIMIENIIKDYKWNNLRFKNIQNNELISKLKTYLLDT